MAVYVAQAAAEQAGRGWRVAVACPPEGELVARLAAAGVPHLPWRAGRSPGPGTLAEARRLRGLVAAFDPDVVHLHSAKAGLAGRLPGVAGDRRVVFQPHGWSWLAGSGPLGPVSLAWERYAAHRADAVVCVGAGELEQGRAAGVRGAFHMIRNGVDRDRFRPAGAEGRAAARAALGVPPSARLAVCIGRLTRQKGQDVLLAAWPLVRERRPDAELVLVGDGDAADQLRGQAGPGVLLVPAVADPRPWLAAADVVVMPSRWEGLPLAALEALAVGRSLVASDVPGLAEVVAPGRGALVPAEDAAALAAAVAERLSAPGLADAEGAAGAAAAAGFDMADTFASLAGLVAGLAGTPAASLGAGSGPLAAETSG
ncbi:glycosyltransferase [Actinomadura parmotrematis]|uniref:Glycosyltransferase n=1 Tax=Actinomadura parmotrematis TaxID=2864039 RepID=A0ABS7G3G9_9ACTN|nr:glycosyltransferase [Actinomadura parmotrematis]MBW8486895.1 glycosyltransferase [Actinomadura parmotrematis]